MDAMTTPRVAAANKALLANIEASTGIRAVAFDKPESLEGLGASLTVADLVAMRECLVTYWSQLSAALEHEGEEVPASLVDELEHAVMSIDARLEAEPASDESDPEAGDGDLDDLLH